MTVRFGNEEVREGRDKNMPGASLGFPGSVANEKKLVRISVIVPLETSVTEHTGDMGYTFSPERGLGGMPWKESSVMDERIRFVIRLKDGESMAALPSRRSTF